MNGHGLAFTAYRELMAGSERIELEGIMFMVIDRSAPPIGGFAGARMLVRRNSQAYLPLPSM